MARPYSGIPTTAPNGSSESDQPRWRRDFPIDWPQDEYVARRDFIKFLALTSLAFVAGQFWIIAQNFWGKKSKPPALEIAPVDAIPVGGYLLFDYPGPHQPCVLVRLEHNRFVAYDQKCTHLSCPVLPDVQANRFRCPCHEGVFEIGTGRPLAGPPRRPLARVRLEIRDGRVYAFAVQRRAS